MEDRVRWIEYYGKKILFMDSSNSNLESVLDVLERGRNLMRTVDDGLILGLWDITNAPYPDDIKRETGKLIKVFEENPKIRLKTALVGVPKTQKMIDAIFPRIQGQGDNRQ